jgi:hypothetical protein
MLESYLQSEGLPSPSFSPSFPAKLPLPESIAASQQQVLEASDELHCLLLGPLGFILHQLDGTVGRPSNQQGPLTSTNILPCLAQFD